MTSTVDAESKAIAGKIVDLVKAEDQRLVDAGVDRAIVGDLVNGAIIALVGNLWRSPDRRRARAGRGAARLPAQVR